MSEADSAMEVSDASAAPAVPRERHSLAILGSVKASQRQNGLMHSDYQRYRQYCGRRLRRMRVAVKFTYGHKHFKPRVMDAAAAADVRHLEILVVNAERAWSYAMHLKQQCSSDPDTAPRYRIHSIRRLRKAVRWSAQLLELCEQTADPETKLEAEAYASWMEANLGLETEQWAQAKQHFTTASTIYSRLAEVKDDDVYAQRNEEIEPSIRYCDYNLERFGSGGAAPAGGAAPSSEADTIALLEMKNSNNELLKAKLDLVLEETRKQRAEKSGADVSWLGHSVPVKSGSALSGKILQANDLELELSAAGDKEEKYTELLGCYDEALRAAAADVRELESAAEKSRTAEATLGALKLTSDYAEFKKLHFTLARHGLLVASREAANAGGKELASLYHQMAGYITSMLAIPGVMDDDALHPKLLAAQKEGYIATRCFHSARTFMDREQWPQAYVLFQRAMEAAAAAAAANAAAGASKNEVVALGNVGSKSDGLRAAARAKGFFAANEAELRLSDDMSSLTLAAQGERLGLMDRLGKIVPEDATLSDPSLAHLASFPPAFQELSCRPLLFDLASEGLAFPSLKEFTGKSGLLGRLFGR